MEPNHAVSRRDCLRLGVGAALTGLSGWPASAEDSAPTKPKSVAAVVTVYGRNSHADVLLTKILEGWQHDGGPGPALKLASIYIDQPDSSEFERKLCEKHGVPRFDSIEQAVTVGGKSIPVDGVLSIGEHGNYPTVPETQQVMYPRRRFFDEIVATFNKCNKVVPVFNDKHLSYAWGDAKHMFDTARGLEMPFMAGSSIPVAWRSPSETLPLGSEVTEAIALGYGSLEHYGFHALEGMQCLMERRKGGETGVKSVQSVTGDGIWQAERDGRWSKALFDAVVEHSPSPNAGKIPRPRLMAQDAVFYLIEYRDGAKATIAMGTGFSHEFACAVSIRGREKPFAVTYLLQDAPFGHFEHLLRAVEHMLHAGKAAWPVERTLLTTGILDAALHSLADKNRRLETPQLEIGYEPVDWPFAMGTPAPPRG